MTILRSLHRGLKLAQSEERAAVLRYLLLHAVRPLLTDIYGWLVAVQQPVHFISPPRIDALVACMCALPAWLLMAIELL